MAEYGVPFDLRRLPGPMFRAHLAIISGMNQRRREDADELERDASNAERAANRAVR